MKCLLISGGSITDYSILESAAQSADMIICADSGILHAEKLGITPDVWVGDFDSADSTNHLCKRMVQLPVEKDDTDTMSAARIIVQSGADSAALFGSTGTRLDHTLANLFVLKFLLDNGVNASIEDEHNIVFLHQNGSVDISAQEGRFLSILPFCSTPKSVSITGVKYPLCDADLSDNHPIGVSNQITSQKATLTVDNGCVAVFLSRD